MHQTLPGARIHPVLGAPHRTRSRSCITVRTGAADQPRAERSNVEDRASLEEGVDPGSRRISATLATPQRDPRPRLRRGNLGRPARSSPAAGDGGCGDGGCGDGACDGCCGCVCGRRGVLALSPPRARFAASPVLPRDPAATLASAASASARSSARGRDTSLARIAAIGVSFMAGTASLLSPVSYIRPGRTTARTAGGASSSAT